MGGAANIPDYERASASARKEAGEKKLQKI